MFCEIPVILFPLVVNWNWFVTVFEVAVFCNPW